MKVNPIADWSSQELQAYIAANTIPVIPCMPGAAVSIGCQPGTPAVQPARHPEPRWWWENDEKKECGLHVMPHREGGRMTVPVAHLNLLEAESIHIFREAAAQFRAPVLLYSIGKDSTVLLHLARKAFWPAKPPFPLLHIDTTWKFRDMIAFRDKTARELGLDLIVHTNHEGLARGINPFDHNPSHLYRRDEDAGAAAALDAAASMPPSAARGGRGSLTRQGTRVLFRAAGHRWEPRRQRPRCGPCSMAGSARARRPRLPAVELDRERCVALHRAREARCCSALFRRPAPRVARDGQLIMVDDERMKLPPGETPETRNIRFRTLGCWPLTAAVESEAATSTRHRGSPERQEFGAGRAADRP